MNKDNNNYISLVFLFIITIFVFSTSNFHLEDDAYISFRYSYNLANSGDLVFNQGERVEGFTNLLWVLILTGQFLIFNFPIEQFTLFLSLILIAFLTFRISQLGHLFGTTYTVGVLAASLLLLNPEFIGTATNGLETSLFSALLVEIIYQYYHNRLKLSYFYSGLLFVTRPEGIFIGLIFIGLLYAQQRSVRQLLLGIVFLLSPVILVTIFRLYYYGMLIPNTVVAKSFDMSLLIDKSSKITTYFFSFIESNPYLVIILLTLILSTLKKIFLNIRLNFLVLFCLFTIIFSFIVTIRNGGDWMDNHRLLLQYGVLYSVIFIYLIKQKIIPILLAYILVSLPFLQTTKNLISDNDFLVLKYKNQTDFWAETSKRLGPVINYADTLSAEALGYTSYHLIYNHIHDPVGLTDAYIAKHGKPSLTYGKHNSTYTVGIIKPSVMIWHHLGHIKGVDQMLLDNYETYCFGECDSWNADVVMIRKDRLNEIAPAFFDWQQIKVKTNSISRD